MGVSLTNRLSTEDRKTLKQLRKRTQSQWLWHIYRFTDKGSLMRYRLSATIWWDYVDTLDSTDQLRTIIENTDEEIKRQAVDQQKYESLLISVGYPSAVAKERSRPKIKEKIIKPDRRGRPRKNLLPSGNSGVDNY